MAKGLYKYIHRKRNNMFISNNGLDLQLFAEGSASSGEGAAGTVSGEKGQAVGAGQSTTGDDVKAAGAAAEDGSEAGSNDKDEDLDREYRELMAGKFKKQRQADFDSLMKARLSKYDEVRQHRKDMEPALRFLSDVYGIDVKDGKALGEAIVHDIRFGEELSLKDGGDPAENLEKKRLEIRERMRTEAETAQKRALEQREKVRGWINEVNEKELTKKYPGFDLGKQLQNDRFKSLLDIGFNVEEAFEAINHKRIMTSALEAATKKASKATVDKIAAHGQRPSENGLSNQAASVSKGIDVQNLTGPQIRKILAEAEAGKRIKLF